MYPTDSSQAGLDPGVDHMDVQEQGPDIGVQDPRLPIIDLQVWVQPQSRVDSSGECQGILCIQFKSSRDTTQMTFF